MKSDFFNLIDDAAGKNNLESLIGVLGLGALGGFLIISGVKLLSSSLWFILLILFGLIPLGIAILFARKMKGSGYWVNLIKDKPEQIIWIKPISVRHTVGFVISLYKENKFQLLTIDGTNLTINCTSDGDRKIFLEGVRNHISHAHVGYSPEILKLYFANRLNFIQILQLNNAYTPIGVFNI